MKSIVCQDALDLQQSGALILDVRETWELSFASIDGALNIPMSMLMQSLASLAKGQITLCLCHHGIRSQHVVRFLESHGFEDVRNISGGIDAWARQLDPNLSRY